jgi:hypothetical protein
VSPSKVTPPNPLDQYLGIASDVDPANPPFTTSTQNVNPFYFSLMTTDRRKAFSHWITSTAPTARPDRYFRDHLAKNAKDLLQRINSGHVRACQNEACCMFLSDVLYGINKDALGTLSPVCANQLASDIVSPTHPQKIKMLDLLPDLVLTKYGKHFVGILGNELVGASPATVAKILKGKEACKTVKASVWELLLNNAQIAKLITKECIRADHKEFSLVVSSKPSILGGSALESYNYELTAEVTAAISKSQLQNLAKDSEDGQNPGKHLLLNSLGRNAEGLTLRLLLGHLYGNPKYKLKMSRVAWEKVPDAIFAELQDDDVGVVANSLTMSAESTLPDPADDFQGLIRKVQLEGLVRHSEICAILRPVTMNKKAAISKECFNSMKPATQAAAIVLGGELPDNVLEDVTRDIASQWVQNDATELSVLTLASRRSNFGAMLARLGANADHDHPCGLISNKDILKNLPVLQDRMSVQCFQRMGFTPTKEDFAVLKPRLSYLMPFIELKKSRPAVFWTTLTPEVMKFMVSGGMFCSHVDVETLLSINRAAYTGIDMECFHQLRYLASQLPADVIRALPAPSLRRETATTIPASFISHLSAVQLGQLGSEAGDVDNVANLFTLQMFNNYTAEHLGQVTAKQWQGTKPDIFETFDRPDRLATVQGDSMIFWTKDQISKIPNEVLLTLTVEQAEKISKAVDSQTSALHHLMKIGGFPSDVGAILSQRYKEAGIESDSISTLSIVLIVGGIVAVLAVIGVGAYFYTRRNN